MKIHFWKSKQNNEWYWHLVAANGQIVATGGEGYKNKQDLLDITHKILATTSKDTERIDITDRHR